MLPLLVTAIGGFFEELGASLAKQNILARVASVYTIGFLNTLFGALILCGTVIFFGQEFVFSSASLPTFALRSFLEILQTYATLRALSEADRSTQGFLRVLTLPLLLLVDVILGYTLTAYQVIGVGFIIFAFIFLFINHGIKKKGSGFVLFGAINAVATISLYKYDITHYNSVAAEQVVMFGILLVYFLLMAVLVSKENPFRAFRNKKLLAQSVLRGGGGVIVSFAYNLASASVITTIKRSGEVLWSILSGNVFFREKRFFVKVVAFALMVVGIVLLV